MPLCVQFRVADDRSGIALSPVSPSASDRVGLSTVGETENWFGISAHPSVALSATTVVPSGSNACSVTVPVGGVPCIRSVLSLRTANVGPATSAIITASTVPLSQPRPVPVFPSLITLCPFPAAVCYLSISAQSPALAGSTDGLCVREAGTQAITVIADSRPSVHGQISLPVSLWFSCNPPPS
ncbi:TPA: hypothetical protein ACHJX8_003855 [Yersinia enterocolitica]|uniref:hypothetical protein n=1 Tax=Yersinia frederiksenii TaxID=29484 RepID=UPI00163FBD56|nr:hypothetical protein [Yersinia frederiksenii]